MWNSISIRDTAIKTELRENFYYGMLLEILQYEDGMETIISYGIAFYKKSCKVMKQ